MVADSPGSGLDLGAYLTRIGASAKADLAEIHRAQLGAIPFENLDPHRGVPVALDVTSLQAKLIHAGRGGYCFEQNLLLKAALEALGHRVALHLARTRWNPGEPLMARTHLVLAIDDGDMTWLGDVGFGPGSLLEPVPFAPTGPHEQYGWIMQIVEEAGQLVLQTVLDDRWRDLYAIDPEPVPMIDVEVSNWYVSTHPASRFVTGLMLGLVAPDGSQLTLRGEDALELATRTATTTERRAVTLEAVPELLETRFGLPGFSLSADGRIRPTDDVGDGGAA